MSGWFHVRAAIDVMRLFGTRLFANTPGAKQVTVIDREKQAVVAEWKLTDPNPNYPAALDEKNHRLFVCCRNLSRLLVLDTNSGKTIASIETGDGTDDISFGAAARRMYLACGAGGWKGNAAYGAFRRGDG